MIDIYVEKKVFILVVTYNAAEWVTFFGENFSKLPKSWDVIVVDNASQDSTCELIRSTYPHFILIKSEMNLGFGKANNIGLKYALENDADYVFLLNQDAAISVEGIAKMIEIQCKYPEFFILSPVHFNGDSSDLDLAFASYCLPPACPQLYADALRGGMKDIYESLFGNAAAWLLSRDCLRLVGGFNPIFTHYGEDDEYRNRVYFYGYKLGIIPEVFAQHDRANRQEKDPLLYFLPHSYVKLLNLKNNYNFWQFSADIGVQCVKKLFRTKFSDVIILLKSWVLIVRHREKIRDLKRKLKQKKSHFLDD